MMSDKGKKFSIKERLKSFRFAFNGIWALIRYEHNFRIHLAIFIVVLSAGTIFRISLTEWLAVLFVSALVLVSESFNTSLEHLSDVVSPGADEKIRRAKDTAAAAVLISAMAAILTGIMIFGPKLLKLIDCFF